MKKTSIIQRYRIFSLMMAVTFLAGILGIAAVNLFTADRVFSEKENRMLATRPDYSLEKIASGRFQEDTEEYVSDQFAGRDFLVSLKAEVDQLIGKRESGGVFLGRDGYLYERFIPPEEDVFEETVSAMNSFAARHEELKLYTLIAPTAVNIYSDRLPFFAPVQDQNPYLDRLFSEINGAFSVTDVRETFLRNRDDQHLYYRTDHHWTTPAAYLAFQSISENMGIDANIVDYDMLPVTENFQGTLSAKSGFLSSVSEPLWMCFPKEEIPLVVYDVEGQTKTASLYAAEKLQTRDAYGVFLGGNAPLIEIETSVGTTRTLLIVKDSYANCFVPFLVPYYSRIVAVDPRYYYGSLDELIDYYDIGEILFLYNANTFFQDTSLRLVLQQQDGAGASGE